MPELTFGKPKKIWPKMVMRVPGLPCIDCGGTGWADDEGGVSCTCAAALDEAIAMLDWMDGVMRND